ncbi:hypothetical protein [Pseudomonas shahriarae]|uniref:hypothetical protein n=1 Tax=Pseudomonas shahriarae TaxID=2745512 RepID=UPI00235F00EC|nr:hypothetical protein [Pseudomonas shahriarae]MDD1133494.1 hypothetical protein [Pseudomonas shahriarae]
MKSLLRSKCEEAMVDVLHRAKNPLTLGEIVVLIHKTAPSLLTGASPTKSLYSMLLRREGFRAKHGVALLFTVSKERGSLLYSLANIK